VRQLLSNGGSPLGPPLVRAYGNAGEHSVDVYWLYLGAFTVAFFAAAWLTLIRSCGRGRR